MKKRKDRWERYYLGIAKEVSKNSTCKRTRFGAVIVRGEQIIATGYTGAVRKAKDCKEWKFCLRDKLKIPHGEQYEKCRSVHAEENAIVNAARAGVSLYDGDIYIYGTDIKTRKKIDTFPCLRCKKLIINAGLNKVVCSTSRGFKEWGVEGWVLELQTKDILETEIYSR